MDIHDLTRQLNVKNDSKIVMLVADGSGRAAHETGRQDGAGDRQDAQPGSPGRSRRAGRQHSRAARHHARQRSRPLGVVRLRSAAISVIGRGALEATGIGFELQAGRRRHPLQLLHARRGRQDHRSPRRTHPHRRERPAGASSSATSRFPASRSFVEPVKEHRFVVVFRGEGLGRRRPRHRSASRPASRRWIPSPTIAASQQTAESPRSSSTRPANCWPANRRPTSRRCAASRPNRDLPTYEEVYGLKAAAIAVYPMYKGLARSGRHGHRRRSHRRWTNRSTCSNRALERLRLLLHPLQVHRQHRRRRQLRRQGASGSKSSTPILPA